MRVPVGVARGFLAGAMLAALPAAAATAKDAAMTIRGAVSDASGAPVPAATVRVLKTRKVRVLGAMPDADQAVEEARTRTDADGRFSIDVPIDHAFPFWFVRFYDPGNFDAVKYSLPQDADISRRIAPGATIETGAVLKFHPDWPRVRAMVDQYGPASRRGQILRSLGLPKRKASDEPGRETWEYPAAGVAYVLDGDKVIETRTFAPAAGAAAGSEPVAAEKVEGP